MSYLNNLSKEDFQSSKLPLTDLLENSLYYPASDVDGGVIKYCNTRFRNLNIVSFIYCDYATGEREFLREKDSFLGYKLWQSRSLQINELIPNGWRPKTPPNTRRREYEEYKSSWKPFARWMVYERDHDRSEDHGPKRFSLMFVGGEGVATYQALYWSNNRFPNALAIIQPGTGFGLNWTDFCNKNGHLAWVVNNNPAGKPKTIFFGGIGTDYSYFDWPGYQQTAIIKNYYTSHYGEMLVFSKTNDSD